MRRAIKLAVATAIVACAVAASTQARAFHAGSQYAKNASAGGGGGIFYTGAPGERRWDCRACHLDPPGQIRASLSASPASLFDASTYAPGESYTITVKLTGEHAGLKTPATNTNGLALSIVDTTGAPAGAVVAFAPDAIVAGGPATIASTGERLGATEWSFTWRAPEASLGRVTVHLGVVDGDGAGTSAPGAFSDPFGDDVYVASVPIEESSSRGARLGAGTPVTLVLALGAVLVRTRRARARATRAGSRR